MNLLYSCLHSTQLYALHKTKFYIMEEFRSYLSIIKQHAQASAMVTRGGGQMGQFPYQPSPYWIFEIIANS